MPDLREDNVDTTTTPQPGQLIQVTETGGFNWKCGRCPGTASARTPEARQNLGPLCRYQPTPGLECGAPRSAGRWTKAKPKTYVAKVSRMKPAITGVPLALLKLAGEKGHQATPWTPAYVQTWKAA